MNNDSLAINALKKVVPRRLQSFNLFKNQSSTSDAQAADPPKQFSPPKDDDKSYESVHKELMQAVEGSSDILAQAKTTFTLFNDTIVVNRSKVSITRRNFFRTAEIISIPVEDILNIQVTTGPLLATIKVMSRVINQQPFEVGKFWRQDAFRVKRIIQGYIIALQREIDCNNIPTKELVETLNKLGVDKQV